MFRNNLELIVGPVCSGKSGELIRRVDRLNIAGYNVLLVKPRLDTRNPSIKSRNGSELKCISLEKAEDVFDVIFDESLDRNKSIDIIAFDEGQFFSDIYETAKKLVKQEYKVCVSALDTDFNGEPFGDIPKLMTLSDSVTKLTAVCMECGSDHAIYSQKLKKGGGTIEVGDLELYHPRCVNCFVEGGIDITEEQSNGSRKVKRVL